MTKPKITSSASLPGLANAIAIAPAATEAQTEVSFRPMWSSAYSMKMLAHGTAKFMISLCAEPS